MGQKTRKSETEWPKNPPLRQGQGEELRDVGKPGDDTVFEANEAGEAKSDTSKRSKKNPRSANDDRARPDDDAMHSRTER